MAITNITEFMNKYREFRTKNSFKAKEGDTFVTLVGRVDNNKNTEFTWSDVNNEKYKDDDRDRYNFLNHTKKIWLYKITTESGIKYSVGIVFAWDLINLIKEVTYNSATKEITMVVKSSAFFWRFHSKDKKSVRNSFKNFSGNIETPISGGVKNMDSHSPIHPPSIDFYLPSPFES